MVSAVGEGKGAGADERRGRMRLIDADRLEKEMQEVEKKAKQSYDYYMCDTIDRAKEYVIDAPTVDAIPREKVEDIKAEIKEKYGDAEICEWFEDFDYEENDISEYRSIGSINDILCIINKHISGKEQEG